MVARIGGLSVGFLEALWTTFTCWMVFLGNYFQYAMIEALDFIVDVFGLVIAAILWVLPTFVLEEPQLEGTAVGWLNYFIPLDFILAGFSAIMLAWILYRLYVVVLRWTKVADDS